MRSVTILLLSILIFLVGCNKETNKDDNNPPTEFIISSLDYCHDQKGIDYQYPIILYYSDGLIIRKIIFDYDPSIQEIEYYYTSKVLNSITVTDFSNKSSNTAEYKYTYEDDLLVEIRREGSDSLTWYFKYDSSGQISEYVQSHYHHYPNGYIEYDEFLNKYYFKDGNIQRCENFHRESKTDDFISMGTSTYTYDDKKNPFLISNDKAIMFQPFYLFIGNYWNKNNMLTYSYSFDWNSYELQYFYTYNDNGYPTTVERVDQLGYKYSFRNIKYIKKQISEP